MTSTAQTAANQANAQHSTGPRTEEGKAISSNNALRHGLTARQVTALDETGEDFVRYCEELASALQPQDAVETALVRRIALLGWRLDRVGRIEAALLDAEDAHQTKWVGWPPHGGHHLAIWPEKMANVDRHESALDRAYQRAMAMLERRQAARRREDAAPRAATETPP